MAVYSISDLEKLTGIKAATLRAWENRYDLVTPRRTATNIRYYLDEDLRELLNIALLNKNGVKISKIAKMPPAKRAAKVASLSSITVSEDTQVDAMTLATVEMDEFKFGHIVDTNIKQRGIEHTMLELIYPFLEKLGVLYFTGSVTPVQESFIGNIIRRKIMAAIDAIPLHQKQKGLEMALYLPDGERQELSLLFVNYLLRVRGFRTIYLGGDISVSDLADFYRARQPDYLFTIVSNAYIHEPVENHVAGVLEACPRSTLLITGYQTAMHDFSGVDRLQVIQGLDAMLEFVKELKQKA